MTSKMTFLLRTGLILVATGAVAHAQFPANPQESAETEELRRYTVEVIIFEYAEDVGLGSEIFVPELVEPEIDPATEPEVEPFEALPEDVVDPGAVAGDEPVQPGLDVQTLARDDLTMNETLSRLERLDAYRPLMHFGWTQATVAEGDSPALPLARFGTPPPGLDGDLKLYLNRFLHLVVNVSKLAPGGDATMRRTRPDIDGPTDRYDRTTERSSFGRTIAVDSYAPLRYRISEDRIMKNGETRYYDHPKIGVIAKVTRIEGDDDVVSAGF